MIEHQQQAPLGRGQLSFREGRRDVNEHTDLGAVVVGTNIGVLLHVPGLRDAGITVRALVGRDRTKAAYRANLLGIPKAPASLAEALTLPNVDLVVVATPPDTHAPLVHEAIASGKHVLCEKPFGKNLAESRGMCEAAVKSDVLHFLGTEFGFDSGQALLRRVVQGGEIGTPSFVMLVLHMGALATPDVSRPAWFDDVGQAGGWLRGAVPHPIDLVRSTLGEFAFVAGSVQRLGLKPNVSSDDTVTMTFTLENGVNGLIQNTAGALGPPAMVTKIVGSRGAAWIDPLSRAVWIDQGSGPMEIPFPSDLVSPAAVPPLPDFITTAYESFHETGNEAITVGRMYKAIREIITGEERTSPEIVATFADGVAIQAIIEAIEIASAECRTVALSEFELQ
jgi:predicted dehydrogenase